jgi:hypothetical protein
MDERKGDFPATDLSNEFFQETASRIHDEITYDCLIITFGINAQLTPIATISPIKIGCSTPTPALIAITPVRAGKIAPPA